MVLYFSGTGNSRFVAVRIAEMIPAHEVVSSVIVSSVIMPKNYLALFSTPGESECKAIMENTGPGIAAPAQRIRSGECFDKPSISFKDRLVSGPVNPVFYAVFVHARGFTVSDRCISCGKCAMIKPAGYACSFPLIRHTALPSWASRVSVALHWLRS